LAAFSALKAYATESRTTSGSSSTPLTVIFSLIFELSLKIDGGIGLIDPSFTKYRPFVTWIFS